MLVLREARFGCDTWAHVVGIPIRYPFKGCLVLVIAGSLVISRRFSRCVRWREQCCNRDRPAPARSTHRRALATCMQPCPGLVVHCLDWRFEQQPSMILKCGGSHPACRSRGIRLSVGVENPDPLITDLERSGNRSQVTDDSHVAITYLCYLLPIPVT